ncbi:MAG: hypothetical protein WGN25_04020 [Candidatus Electrothrix sp. GW3-4]|uniref:hypothetical protein n=1 Tax=Candidatus Electrothrix sp. GW3-4 TaxID=3126740 RepID=UPI0030D1AE59
MKEIREIVSGDRGKLNPPGQQPGELGEMAKDQGGAAGRRQRNTRLIYPGCQV